jgi:hypothetical protein
MSPEQCQEAREAGHRSDIYSLGVMIFEMLTGRPPFIGDLAAVMAAHVSKRPPRISELTALLPAVDDVLARCLAKPPAARFGSARELFDALSRAVEFAGPVREGAAVNRRAPEERRPASARRPVALLAVKSGLPADQLAARVSSDGGLLARVHGDFYLFGFPGEARPEAGVRAAVRAATHLLEQAAAGADAVVHLAELRVRDRPRGLTVAGRALERPEDWLPEDEAPGLRLTGDAAAVAGGDREADQRTAGRICRRRRAAAARRATGALRRGARRSQCGARGQVPDPDHARR